MAKQRDERPEFVCPVREIVERILLQAKCPTEFLDHLRNANVEVLLAVRSLIDQAVERLRKESRAHARPQKIKVTEKE